LESIEDYTLPWGGGAGNHINNIRGFIIWKLSESYIDKPTMTGESTGLNNSTT
jgi:hypothetical protein